MNVAELGNWVMADEPRIVQAVGVGAQWEVWMQVELALVLVGHRVQAARELAYVPASKPLRVVDCLAFDGTTRFVVELKVESATTAGAAVMQGVLADAAKLAFYVDPTVTLARWSVGLAYSDAAKGLFRKAASDPRNRATVIEGTSISMIVVEV